MKMPEAYYNGATKSKTLSTINSQSPNDPKYLKTTGNGSGKCYHGPPPFLGQSISKIKITINGSGRVTTVHHS